MSDKLIVVAIILIGVILFALGNFIFMVVLGALGHIFNVEWLYLSFWQTAIVSVALSIVGGFFKG